MSDGQLNEVHIAVAQLPSRRRHMTQKSYLGESTTGLQRPWRAHPPTRAGKPTTQAGAWLYAGERERG